MQLTENILKNLHDIAIQAAKIAGEYISTHRPTAVEHKNAGNSSASQVLTEIDKESQRIILDALQNSIYTYDLGLLAEEQEDDGSRLEKDYFWCVDPLDGTLPFIENREGYAVAISLVNHSGIPQIGVIYNPVNKRCYSAIAGQGAWLNGERLKVKRSNKHTLFHHRSMIKHPNFDSIICNAKEKMRANDVDIISHAGAVMNAIWCIERAPAYYFALPKNTKGGGCIWDYAASVCIFNEIGLEVSDYYGNPLNLNRPESIYMNEFGVVFSTLR